jgi:hypothetical protein
MDPFHRSSRLVPFRSVADALRAALARVADVPEDQPVLVTIATRAQKPGFLAKFFGGGGPTEVHVALVHLADSVALATHGEPGTTPAWRLPFASLQMTSPPTVPGVTLPVGLTLVSPLLGVQDGSPGSYGVFVGPEPEAAAFLDRIRSAARS